MNEPLTDSDIMRCFDNKLNLFTYSDIHKFNSIDELLGRYKRCIVLFLNKENYGHWTCLFLNKERGQEVLHFFNSYGDLGKKEFDGYPDSFLKYINKSFRDKSNQNYPYLTELMINSPYELEYNDIQYQKLSDDIKTCGYWCVFRLQYASMNDEEFERFIKSNCKNWKMSPDKFIVTIYEKSKH